MLRRAFLLLLLAAACLGAGPAKTARTKPAKNWQTYPMPARSKPAEPMSLLYPGQAIPEQPERYTWQVKAPKNEASLTQVPVYAGAWDGKLSKVGNVPVGTALTLEQVRPIGRVLYYALKFTGSDGKEVTAWVSGTYVAPVGLAAVQ